MVVVVVVAVIVVVILTSTHRHNAMQSVVAGQAPITPKSKTTSGKNENKEQRIVHTITEGTSTAVHLVLVYSCTRACIVVHIWGTKKRGNEILIVAHCTRHYLREDIL